MPVPLDDAHLTEPQSSAKLTKVRLETGSSGQGTGGCEVDAWLFDYLNGGLGHSHEHGGFHIANTIRELRPSAPVPKLPRLALISSFLGIEARAQRLLRTFLPQEAEWLYYFDKAAAMDEAGRDDEQADDWKKRGFVLMLANCIASMDREVWDQTFFNRAEQYGDFVASSPCMQNVRLRISEVSREQIPQNGPPLVVIFNGEPGTGRSTAARAFRLMCGGSSNDLVWNTELNQELDALARMRSDLDSWDRQPSLIIEYFHLMKPVVQDFMLQLIRSGRYRGVDSSQKACPVTRLLFAHMNDEARSQVLDAARNGQEITLPPLRDRKDCFAGLVERIKRQMRRTNLDFDAGLMEILRAQKWGRNVAEFEKTIRDFISGRTEPLLTKSDFEKFANASPAGSTMVATNHGAVVKPTDDEKRASSCTKTVDSMDGAKQDGREHVYFDWNEGVLYEDENKIMKIQLNAPSKNDDGTTLPYRPKMLLRLLFTVSDEGHSLGIIQESDVVGLLKKIDSAFSKKPEDKKKKDINDFARKLRDVGEVCGIGRLGMLKDKAGNTYFKGDKVHLIASQRESAPYSSRFLSDPNASI